jgi:hypothetical protein
VHAVNCAEFDEQIAPAVDERLRVDEAAAFREHASICPGCRRAYEAELSTRNFVRQRMTMVRMPGSVAATIVDRLASERTAGTPARFPRWTPSVYRSVVAVAAVLAAVFLIASPGSIDDPSFPSMREDVFAQSIVTYAGVVGGQMKPDVESARPDVLQSFFTGKTSFPVRIHTVRDFTPIGAMLHESGGVPLAQVLYNAGNTTVYMYQTCWQTVQDGRKLQLPAHILSTLRTGSLYVEENTDGQTMVLWTEGRTLCGAVANMQKQELLAHLDVDPGSSTR